MYPTGFAQGGVIQGNPVPVGSGRHKSRHSDESSHSSYRYNGESDSSGTRSGGSSPDYREQPRFAHIRGPNRHQPMRQIEHGDRHSLRYY